MSTSMLKIQKKKRLMVPNQKPMINHKVKKLLMITVEAPVKKVLL